MNNEKKIVAILAILLLAIHAFISSFAIFAKSPTFDESVHLTGGYTYWKLNDYRINPENGNFPQRWASIPLLFNPNIKLPLDSPHWLKSKEWFFSFFFIFKSGNNPDKLFVPAKFMMLLLSLALCLSVFFISKKIWGSKGALISLAISAFSPTILAHSNLVTSDISAALFFLLSSYFVWQNFKNINVKNTILSCVFLSLLFLSKMSAPIIIPFYLITIFVALRRHEPIICEFRRQKIAIQEQNTRVKTILPLIIIHFFSVFFAIWAFFGFRYTIVAPGSPSAAVVELQWDELARNKSDVIENAIIGVDKLKLLPRGYLHGYLYVKKHLSKRISFMNGKKSNEGFALFFPYCFTIKTPIPTIILCVLSLYLIIRYKKKVEEIAPFAIFAGIFAIFALSNRINIGERHLLPLYPILFIFCGSLADKLFLKNYSFAKFAIGVAVVWLAFESVISTPDHLAYFNQLTGGPKNGYKRLVDSSLDWGQDLKELKKKSDKLMQKKEGNFYLAYFGTASINSYGLQNFISLPGYFTQENFRIHRFKAGTYCVSATMLHLLYYQDIFASLKFPPDILFDDSFEKLQPFIEELLDASEKGKTALSEFLKENGEEFCLRRYQAYDLIRFAKLCEYLKTKPPDEYAGYSILIYKLNQNDIETAMKMKVSF